MAVFKKFVLCKNKQKWLMKTNRNKNKWALEKGEKCVYWWRYFGRIQKKHFWIWLFCSLACNYLVSTLCKFFMSLEYIVQWIFNNEKATLKFTKIQKFFLQYLVKIALVDPKIVHLGPKIIKIGQKLPILESLAQVWVEKSLRRVSKVSMEKFRRFETGEGIETFESFDIRWKP